MAEQYIYPCWLITSSSESESDVVGNAIVSKKKRKVLAAKLTTTQSEYYQARTIGYKTLKTIKVRSMEYHGETKVEFDGEILNVMRVDDFQDGAVKLILWKGVNNQHVIASQSNEN